MIEKLSDWGTQDCNNDLRMAIMPESPSIIICKTPICKTGNGGMKYAALPDLGHPLNTQDQIVWPCRMSRLLRECFWIHSFALCTLCAQRINCNYNCNVLFPSNLSPDNKPDYHTSEVPTANCTSAPIEAC